MGKWPPRPGELWIARATWTYAGINKGDVVLILAHLGKTLFKSHDEMLVMTNGIIGEIIADSSELEWAGDTYQSEVTDDSIASFSTHVKPGPSLGPEAQQAHHRVQC
jgi:hypothetical protein